MDSLLKKMAREIVHDLKHPIQNLKNCGLNLDRAAEDPALRETLKRNFARELDKITQFLHNLENLDGEMPHEPIPLNLNTLLSELLQGFEERAREAKIDIDFHSDPAITLEGDLFSLNRLFTNLIVNAFEAISGPGRIVIALARKNEKVEISIEDSGAGIPEERIGTIFNGYWSSKAKGLGLGLAICKRIVDLHQGSIRAESPAPSSTRGTRFTVELPG